MATADPSHGRKDIDGDGVADCWRARWEGGRGEGGLLVEVESPCGQPPWNLNITSHFSEFIGSVFLPLEVAAHPDRFRGVVDLLFGSEHLRAIGTIDGSFRWLLDPPAITASEPWLTQGRYSQFWSAGAPSLPPCQIMPATGSECEPKDRPCGLVVYYAQNHGAWTSSRPCGGGRLYSTRHGLALYDLGQDKFSWIYISTGVDKLRRPSLGRTHCTQGLVVAERGDGPDTVWVVIDPASGRYGTLPPSKFWDETRGPLIDGPYNWDTLAEVLRKSSWP